MLIQIHGQHDQIKLNNSKYQLRVIDEAGSYQKLLEEVANLYSDWKHIQAELEKIQLAGALNEAESQLLQYQFEELEHLNLRGG